MAHFCPSNPCPICYPQLFPPTISPRGFCPGPDLRKEKLEELLVEVRSFIEDSIFLIGAGNIKKIVKELESKL